MEEKIQALILQGYPPEVARKMVETGGYDQMIMSGNPLVMNGIGLPPLNFSASASQTGERSIIDPAIQSFLDKGYTLEEATQLSRSKNYSNVQEMSTQNPTGQQIPQNPTSDDKDIQYFLNKGYTMEEATQLAQSVTFGSEREEDKLKKQEDFQNSVAGMFGAMGNGVSLEQSAYGLGHSIGDKDTLGIIANSGKLILGGARTFASGLGQGKREQYMEEYQRKKEQQGMGRDNYTAVPQTSNTNYLGGMSYGEDGGMKGETLPLRDFFKNKGFVKPKFRKL
jgi:hypothetical protein